MQDLTHKARYAALRDDAVILRSEQYAKWTLPQLMVDLRNVAASGSQQGVERDYQEMGAILLNNLAAKLAALLFPSTRPFFRASLGPKLTEQALQAGNSPTEIAAALARMEQDACQQLFKNASYNQLVLAVKQLIATGNTLLYRDAKTKRSIAFGLNQFATLRDSRGTLMDCVLVEYTLFDALDSSIQKQLRIADPTRYTNTVGAKPVKVELYTRIHRRENRKGNPIYEVSQEADEVKVGKPGTYPEHLCPWQAPVWSLIPGEHYGRGLVEDYAGGFAKLSDMAEAATLYEISAMKVVNLVTSGSGTDSDTLADAETGEWVVGDPTTVNSYEAGDAKKIEQMRIGIAEVFGRLARAFMYSANTRNAERVTAFELKQDALEAENTLGGNYSALAESIQVPMAHLLLTEERPGILEGIVTKQVKLDIMAGIPALGRAADVQNLIMATQEGGIAVQLTQLDKRIDPAKVMDMVYAGQSIDTASLFKSDEQLQQEAKADAQIAQGEQRMAMASGLAETGEAIGALPQG